MMTPRELAEEMVARFRREEAPHIVAPAHLEDCKHLDHAAYERFRDQLERRGYVLLGDYQFLDIDSEHDALLFPTVCRYMLSADRGTCAAYYQLRRKTKRLIRQCVASVFAGEGIWQAVTRLLRSIQAQHFYDLESELGAQFIGTSNAAEAGVFSAPPTSDIEYLPEGTALESVRIAHERRLASAVQRSEAALTRMTSVADVWAIEDRLKRVKHAWREAAGVFTMDELTRLTRGNVALARKLYEEIQAILRAS
jgi:hypothetical protein